MIRESDRLITYDWVMPKAPSIPDAAKPAYEAIVARTDAVSQAHLNQEWAALCRELAAALARKRPSPLLRGEPAVWAAGINHALGMVNFLFDRSQTPSISARELAGVYGVNQTTMTSKSKQIRQMFKITAFDPNWTLPSKMDHNPRVWLISVNGLLLDARYLPREVQIEAYQRGFIPYIPGEKS